MRRMTCWMSIAICGAFTAASLADPPMPKGKPKPKPAAKSATSRPAGEKPVRNRAVQAMKIVVENAEFDEMPLEDFIEWLERLTQANVVVRWKVLESAGIDKDRPLTLKQKDMPLGKLLPLAFEALTKGLEGVELAAKAQGNVLLIPTRADLNSKLITRSYEIEALRVVVPDFKGRRVNIDAVGQGGRQQGGVVAPGSGGGHQDQSIDAETQRLINVIIATVDPPSWQVNGGKGTITVFKSNLIIRNSEEAHDAIQSLLGADTTGGKTPKP